MDEYWSEIPGYPSYAVSNHGEVVNMKYGRPVKARANGRGYERVVLYHGGEPREFYIHTLVAESFIGGYRPGTQISHYDEDRQNNAVNNLRIHQGRRNDHAIDTENTWGQRIRILETGEIFRTVRDCARYIGGDYGHIYACLRGQRGKHLGYSFEYFKE